MGEYLIQALKEMHSHPREQHPRGEMVEAAAAALCLLTLYRGEYAQDVADGFAESVLDALVFGVAGLPDRATQ